MARELVISFLYGEFNAALVDGARVVERWSPSASDRAHGFHEAAFRYFLESAVDQFDYTGEEAVLVVADVEMEHHQVALPPVKKKQQQQLLTIEAEKLAEGRSLTWSYLPIPQQQNGGSASSSGFDKYLMHCWPAMKLKGYLADFAHVGITPRLIVPDVTLFLAWSAEADLEANSCALVNSSENGTTVILSDVSTGKLFVRRLSPAIGHSKVRLPAEIRRSIQYASQDMGLRPELLVTNDQQLAIDLQPQLDRRIDLEIEASWADQPVLASYCSELSRRDPQSFVPDEVRYAKYNQLINRVVKAGIALIAITSLVTVAWVEWRLSGEESTAKELADRYELRQQELHSLQSEVARLSSEQQFAEQAQGNKQRMTYWLLMDLGALLPDAVVLDELKLAYEQPGRVDVALKAAVTVDNLQRLDDDMREFGENLATAPWLVEWPNDWLQKWREQYINASRGQHLELEINGNFPL